MSVPKEINYMDIKEIKLKEAGELNHLLAETRKKLDELMFKARQKQLKNIREIREVKKDVAKLLTVLKTKNK
jgi:ribosomal protein L29